MADPFRIIMYVECVLFYEITIIGTFPSPFQFIFGIITGLIELRM